MIPVCLAVCQQWDVEFTWLTEISRAEHRPIMKTVLWIILRNRFPTESYKNLAAVVGNKDHSCVSHSLKRAKDWLSVKDPVFMQYYNPVKHMLNDGAIVLLQKMVRQFRDVADMGNKDCDKQLIKEAEAFLRWRRDGELC